MHDAIFCPQISGHYSHLGHCTCVSQGGIWPLGVTGFYAAFACISFLENRQKDAWSPIIYLLTGFCLRWQTCRMGMGRGGDMELSSYLETRLKSFLVHYCFTPSQNSRHHKISVWLLHGLCECVGDLGDIVLNMVFTGCSWYCNWQK